MSEAVPANARERAKLAAVPVLALVLLWVVTRGEEEALPPPVALADPAAAGSPAAPGANRTAPPASGDSQWPDFALAEIVAHDPFAVPRAIASGPPSVHSPLTQPVSVDRPENTADQGRSRRQMLGKKRVSVIYRGPHGPTAIIDSRVYREGDKLEDGVRIVEIRADGVFVEVEVEDVY